MKQVIIRIRDDKNKLVAKTYFYNIANYEFYAHEFVQKQLMPGMECNIKVGNQFSKYFTYEDCQDTLNDYNEDYENLDDVIYHEVKECSIMYYVENYLPRY